MLVTIVVPIYNSEKFLSRCLKSIQNQTYKNIEVIMVNDGSQDNSLKICLEFANKDSRFTVINKENGGVSSARNVGIEKANGEYINFIDPDDWIDNAMIERLYSTIKKYNSDISICNYVKEYVYNDEQKQLINVDRLIKTYDRIQALNEMLKPNSFKGFVWNKLFSLNLIKENKIKFDENINFCEDLLFCCETMLKAKKIVYDNSPFYHYFIHSNNITSGFNIKKISSLDAIEKIINLLDKSGVSILKKTYITYYMHMNISLLLNSIKINANKNVINQLKMNLFKYRLTEVRSKKIFLSCLLSRLSTKLTYFLWAGRGI
ncbi:glycosyltransferase [Heyndrickxia faecalis]|uniref:glycosyltransferase n=1 Tax=Heyndrickxia faecalis TaxID=2824910 RepID=UPI003D2267BA